MSHAAPIPRVIAHPWSAREAAILREGLRAGAVMTYPTETTYALGGNALLAPTAETVYRLKGRGPDKALLLLVDGATGVEGLAREVSPVARRLMAGFWPGPLTLVLRADPALPAHLVDARGTVALRWSPNPVVGALLQLGGVPLIGTSANRSGTPGLTTVADVLASLPPGIALAVDGGPAPGGPPSTLVDTTVEPCRVLREGAIPAEAIRQALA